MIKGIVRNLDPLGRITLPVEMKRAAGMQDGKPVDMYIYEDDHTHQSVIRICKATEFSVFGIVRNIDQLGRVVLPKEYRKSLRINESDPVEIYKDGSVICIKTVKLQCVCCGSTEESELIEHNGVHMCLDCIGVFAEEVLK